MDEIRTGDMVLFSNNELSGFFLKLCTKSDWTHAGIAVRFQDGDITLDRHGTLYILEINSMYRHDPYFQTLHNGLGFTSYTDILDRYNYIGYRSLDDRYRTPEFVNRTWRYLYKYAGANYPRDYKPFFGVWLGVGLSDIDDSNMICSEAVAQYYKSVTNKSFSELFGTDAPMQRNLYKPNDFTYHSMPRAALFASSDRIIKLNDANFVGAIVYPLLISIILVMIVFSMM